MDYSILLAQIIGLYFTIMGIALLANQVYYLKLFKSVQKQAGMWLPMLSVIPLVIGLVIVSTHSVWESNYKGFITFIGWAAIMKALAYLFAPKAMMEIMKRIDIKMWLQVKIALSIVIGVYFLFVGFTT